MFNFNFGLQQIDGFGDFDYTAFERELAALTSVATVAAVNSPAVVQAPQNTAPNIPAVQEVVSQVVQSVAPVIAPSIPPTVIAKLEQIIPTEVASNPQVKASDVGVIATPAVVNNITSSIASTFKNDVQKDYELNSAIKQVFQEPTSQIDTTQSNLANSLAALQAGIAESKATVQTKNIEIPTIALEQAVNAGNKTDIINAAKEVAEAQGGSVTTQASNAITAVQNATPKPVLNEENIIRGDQIKWIGGVNGSWQIIKGTNVSSQVLNQNQPVNQPVNQTVNQPINTVTPTGLDAATTALIQGLQSQIAAMTATINNQTMATNQAAINKAAADAAAKKEKTENAITVLTDRFTRYGLASLVPKIKELAIGGASESTITLQLQESEEYRNRFRANQERIKKGLSVLDPAEYLGLEDDYRQILRAYGLRQFDNDNYVQQFISNDISTTELSNRVTTAVQRVQNADPAVLTTLRGFYGITDNDLVGYVLDPEKQFQKIERQVAAAEIGAAAKLQGINAGVAVSEQLAAQGITKAQAQKGYATIADILPTAEKLSDIYGKTMDEYRINEAEQEVFNTLASAQRKRQKLSEREIAAFGGSSGVGKASLRTQLGGTI